MFASPTVLVDALNRLGGRQRAEPIARDLVVHGPSDLPLVAVRTPAGAAPAVTACNVSAFMTRVIGLEAEAFEALRVLIVAGTLDAAVDPGADPAAWVTADPRGVARQGLQWALDHPEAGLSSEAFDLARLVLD